MPLLLIFPLLNLVFIDDKKYYHSQQDMKNKNIRVTFYQKVLRVQCTEVLLVLYVRYSLQKYKSHTLVGVAYCILCIEPLSQNFDCDSY